MNFECKKCGEQIEGDFDEMDSPQYCEECENYLKNKSYDEAVDFYGSVEGRL